MDTRTHWEQVYATKRPDEVSWYQPYPLRSLALIDSIGLARDAPIIDVGAGASPLVDHLLERGFQRVTALDVAGAALERSRARLGARVDLVRWAVGDVLDRVPDETYDLWHDRAVFHFLTNSEDRLLYVANLRAALSVRGHVIIAAFAPDGPQKCSGLEVARHDGASIAAELGPDFRLLREEREDHVTPWGATQRFVYTLFRRAAVPGA
jgi:hypothetical protein